jgi:hypothetical protein
MNNIKIIEQDIIFLSYDEPNAEKNYADLVVNIPWAKRVHGVKGSDAAHKACAALSNTEYFVTVDADNIVDPKFFNIDISLDLLGLDDSYVFSWCGKNHVNGLMYGNGGLKLWTKTFVNAMRTHENANQDDIKNNVEFCFDPCYYQFDDCYSESFTNESAFQAWRAGFREGVKMSLHTGSKVKNINEIWRQNYDRLLVWCNVGADVKNGIWSMLGAREGCYLTNCTDWDYSNVRDFGYLTDLFNKNYTSSEVDLDIFKWYGAELRTKLKIPVADLDADASKFFKSVYVNTPRRLRR